MGVGGADRAGSRRTESIPTNRRDSHTNSAPWSATQATASRDACRADLGRSAGRKSGRHPPISGPRSRCFANHAPVFGDYPCRRPDFRITRRHARLNGLVRGPIRVLHMSFRYARANVVVADKRPNLVRGQFMVPLMVDGRAMALAGDWFEEALTQSGADMFATNACYGAQQRVLAEYPFPGRLVQKGLRVAIAARDTLEASAAAIFYSTFYRCLADGLSIVRHTARPPSLS